VKRDASSPQTYRASVTGALRATLEGIRSAVLEVAPDTRETIEHGMLAYPGIAHLAAQKRYVSFYIAPEVLDDFRHRLPRRSGKSCIRFGRSDPIDPVLLREIVTALRDR